MAQTPVDKILAFMHARATAGLQRKRIINTGDLLDFAGNDYLGLARMDKVRNAFVTGYQKYHSGSGGSMLVGGYHAIHQELETTFARALAVDGCILFNNGYAANLALCNLLGKIGISALLDREVHASIYDGMLSGQVQYQRYQHLDVAGARKKFVSSEESPVIFTESLFSMSGQRANIAQLADFAGGNIIVDEAHAFGIIGPMGLGLTELQGLTAREVPLRMLAFGKAMGAFGAIIAGSGAWIEALLQVARPAIYSTSMAPAIVYGLLETFDILRAADDRRQYLTELIAYFRSKIVHSPLAWRDCQDTVQYLKLGCPRQALDYAEKLRAEGIFCIPMRQPTVTKENTGLRITLNYHHTAADIDLLFNCLHHVT